VSHPWGARAPLWGTGLDGTGRDWTGLDGTGRDGETHLWGRHALVARPPAAPGHDDRPRQAREEGKEGKEGVAADPDAAALTGNPTLDVGGTDRKSRCKRAQMAPPARTCRSSMAMGV
jgi:hypothetical protein